MNVPAVSTNTAKGEQRPGGTGLLGEKTVSRIGYGAMQLERLAQDPSQAHALLRRADELGVDHIDTAQFYGNGLVNSLIFQALRPSHLEGVVIATKVGADPDPQGPFPMRPAQRPEELRASVEENLRSLGMEQIPLVNLRRMEGRITIPMPAEQQVDLDDQIAAMTEMRDEGLIGAFGLSSVTLESVRQTIPAGVACVQNDYSLLARQDENILALCTEENIAWVPFFPLGSAFPGMPKVTDDPVVQKTAASRGVTPSQMGLAWLLHHAPNVLLIPGTASIEHLEENIAIEHLSLDAATVTALDAIPSQSTGSIG